jgi:hypothetical protein
VLGFIEAESNITLFNASTPNDHPRSTEAPTRTRTKAITRMAISCRCVLNAFNEDEVLMRTSRYKIGPG